jgi:hypothetical protein
VCVCVSVNVGVHARALECVHQMGPSPQNKRAGSPALPTARMFRSPQNRPGPPRFHEQRPAPNAVQPPPQGAAIRSRPKQLPLLAPHLQLAGDAVVKAHAQGNQEVSLCVCVYVCVCVNMCAHTCVCACARACASVWMSEGG